MAKAKDAETSDQETSWPRFERSVDVAVKSGPKHKHSPAPVNKKERPSSKGRVHKSKAKS